MTVLFDGKADAVDGCIFAGLDTAVLDAMAEIEHAFVGQVQGLLGAAVPGVLLLQVGIQRGDVGLRIELLEGPPEDDPDWEDVVEATFTPIEPRVTFENFDDTAPMPSIELPVRTHRVRYCGKNLDAARERLMLDEDQAPIDCFALFFWPSDVMGDRIIRLTSETSKVATVSWVGQLDDYEPKDG